jgi:hypothetical protein
LFSDLAGEITELLAGLASVLKTYPHPCWSVIHLNTSSPTLTAQDLLDPKQEIQIQNHIYASVCLPERNLSWSPSQKKTKPLPNAHVLAKLCME